MSKHTEGPWEWQEQKGDHLPMLFGANNSLICEFGTSTTYYPTEGTPPDKDDALLIAAAPELLAALELAVLVINNEADQDDYKRTIAIIRAAINKAKGRAV